MNKKTKEYYEGEVGQLYSVKVGNLPKKKSGKPWQGWKNDPKRRAKHLKSKREK